MGTSDLQAVTTELLRETRGSVYTKEWVVRLILDLCAYTSDFDLACSSALEPAAGEGAFALEMVKRLMESSRKFSRDPQELGSALILFEIDPVAAERLRYSIVSLLQDEGVSSKVAEDLCDSWIRVGDYLLSTNKIPKVDFVLGNPPYIRLENLDERFAAMYRRLFPTMRGRADIYVGFFEAGLRQLKEGGVCGFICADRWMRNSYGSHLRALIHRLFSVDWIIELHEADAFEDEVDAYPAVTVIRRRSQELVNIAEVVAQTTLEGLRFRSIEPWLNDDEPWPNGDPESMAKLVAWNKLLSTLEEEATGTFVGIGVASGADKIYVTRDEELVEKNRLLPLALGSDVSESGFTWSRHFLVNPWNEKGLVDLKLFPKLQQYFESHSKSLKARHVGKKSEEKFYRTIDRVDYDLLTAEKLYIPDIRSRLVPVLDSGWTYPHHNLYFIISRDWDLEVLGGILLSEQAQLFISAYAMKMRGGFYRYQAQYLRRIRVPRLQNISEDDAQEFRDAFRDRDSARSTLRANKFYPA